VRRAVAAKLAAAAALLVAAPAQAVTLPAGFSDELVATVSAPTAVAFTPDGRMLVTTQPGQLRVRTAGGTLLATPALDLSSRVCSNSERGLLGVAVDPKFALNHFIYAYYTSNKFNSCATGSPLSPVNRIARFVLADDNTVDFASGTVLVDDIPSWAGTHNGGDVGFGKDGQLYVSVGDGGCDYAGNSGCAAQNDAARDQHVLLGKILRITPSGGIPADNPFQGAGTARCNVTGRTSAGSRCQETYAWGLRNPFRIAFDPNAAGTRFYINDVGQNAWEEIDLGTAGADYGWNVREGHCATGSTTNCGAPPAGMTDPIFDYGRSDGCGSITGGAFVPNVIWPPDYRGKYLFSDYVCGRIFRLDPNGAGGFTRVDFATGLGAGSAVHLLFGPAGTSQALYYTTYAGGGAVRRIVFNAGNTAPTAALTASPRTGAAPLLVNFDGSGSRDPDSGDTLTYIWNFGDGTASTETASANTSHGYQSLGTYTASLQVRDSRGATSTAATVRIDVGNTPPQPAINSPVPGQRFAVGEAITLDGSATDPQEGTLPGSRLVWTVERVHSTHTHPYLTAPGSSSSFTGPPPEDLAATTNSYVLVTLTATDSQGLSASISRVVQPKLVDLTLTSKPGDMTLELNGAAFSTPRTSTAWEGWQLSVNAPDQGRYRFISWSDGGARSHMITAPARATTYQATFRR
jgi:glucose/arabinose dehydrogenase